MIWWVSWLFYSFGSSGFGFVFEIYVEIVVVWGHKLVTIAQRLWVRYPLGDFFCGFTLYPAHSKVGKWNLVLKHSISHFPASSGVLQALRVQWRTTGLFIITY